MGLRLILRGPRAVRWRFAAAAITATLTSLVLLGTAGIIQVGEHRHAKLVAQAPIEVPGDQGGLLLSNRADWWHDEPMQRVLVASNARAPAPLAVLPPGLTRLPRSGEAAVSPRVMLEVREDPAMHERLAGFRLTEIAPSGLVSQDELIAYLGTSPGELRKLTTASVAGFGDREEVSQLSPTMRQNSVLILLMFVFVPFFIVSGNLVRLGAAQQRRRLRSLSVLGIPQRDLIVLMGLETTLGVIVGALAAVLVYDAIGPVILAQTSVAGLRPYASDLVVPIWQQLLVAVAVVAVGGAAAFSMARAGLARNSPNRPAAELLRPNSWALVPLGVATILLASAWIWIARVSREASINQQRTLIAIAVAMALLGLAVSLRTVVQLLASACLRVQRLPMSVRVALRRLYAEPGSVSRSAALIGSLVMLTIFSTFLLVRFSVSDWVKMDLAIRDNHGRTLSYASPTDADFVHDQRLLRAVPGAVLLPALTGDVDGQVVVVVLATCQQVRTLAGTDVTCPSQPSQITTGNRPSTAPPPGASIRLGDRRLVVGRGLLHLDLPIADGGDLSAAILVPERDAGVPEDLKTLVDATWITTPADPTSIELLRGAVARGDSPSQLIVNGDGDLHGAVRSYKGYASAITWALVIAVVLGGIGLCVSIIETAASRSREQGSLRVLGIPRRALSLQTALEAGGIAVLAVAVGILFGVAAGAAYLATPGQPYSLSAKDLSVSFILAATLVAAATASAWVASLLTSDTRALHD